MEVETTVTNSEPVPEQPTVTEVIESVETAAESWQQQFSEAVSVMQEVITEVRKSNTENETLRTQVSQLLEVNTRLTEQIAVQASRQMESATSLTQTALVTQPTPMPRTDASQTESQESDQETVVVETETVETPAEPTRRKRQRI